MEEVAISVRELKKFFRVPQLKKRGLSNRIKSYIGLGNYRVNKVINGISFDVTNGECFGILGPNGCGKSTLLMMLAGVLYPDEGTITISGKVVPLLNLGAGLQNDLTAEDNVFQYGALLGIPDPQLKNRFDAIFEYAELQGYEKLQLKNYSHGMRVRLAFSVAMEVNHEILLLDEVLSVGDIAFKSKSKEKIVEICNSGSTVVIVSHSASTITDVCDRAMFLKGGKIGMIGDPQEVVEAYTISMEEYPGPGDILRSKKRKKKKILNT